MISVTRSSGDREFLGDQLRLRGLNALSELAFAGVRRDAAVGGDADPRIELPRVDATTAARRRRGPAPSANGSSAEALKQTTSAPEPLRNSRRVLRSIASWRVTPSSPGTV